MHGFRLDEKFREPETKKSEMGHGVLWLVGDPRQGGDWPRSLPGRVHHLAAKAQANADRRAYQLTCLSPKRRTNADQSRHHHLARLVDHGGGLDLAAILGRVRGARVQRTIDRIHAGVAYREGQTLYHFDHPLRGLR
jgi:hypothetical protein